MDVDIRYLRRADAIRVLGLLDEQTIAFTVLVRRRATSTNLLGYDLGRPVTEIAWLEIPESQRGNVKLAMLAVCAALRAAMELSDEVVSLVAVVAMNHRMTARLERRPEFDRIMDWPFPFIASIGSINKLRARLCH